MKREPLISVVVPIYKVEKYLSRCIESILRQSFTDFELLLVDDGSPDNCGVISENWAKTDKRIRVFHQENAGLSAARNTGLDNATGRYAVFIDSDDYVDVDYLANLYSLRPDAQMGLGFAVQGFKKCQENGEVVRSVNLMPHIYTQADMPFLFAGTDIHNMFSAWAKLFDCRFLNKYHLRFNTTLRFAEDILFILECMSCCDYISVGNKADYDYISYAGTMSKVVTPFISEYNTFFSCKTVINKFVASRKLTLIQQQGLFKCIHLLFCRTLKSDYHYLDSISGIVRREHLRTLVEYNMDYLTEYYTPDYLIDKMGRFLLMTHHVFLYDVFFTALFKLKIRKMFSPPGAF